MSISAEPPVLLSVQNSALDMLTPISTRNLAWQTAATTSSLGGAYPTASPAVATASLCPSAVLGVRHGLCLGGGQRSEPLPQRQTLCLLDWRLPRQSHQCGQTQTRENHQGQCVSARVVGRDRLGH